MKDTLVIIAIIFAFVMIVVFYSGQETLDKIKTIREEKIANIEKDNERIKQIVRYALECEEALNENKVSKLKEKSRLAEMYVLSMVGNTNNKYMADIINESFFLFVFYRKLAEDTDNQDIKQKIQEKVRSVDEAINKYNKKLGV